MQNEVQDELTLKENLGIFLDECFGYQSPQHYTTDFAPLFESGNKKEIFLIKLHEQILSSAILFPITLLSENQQYRVGIVGAVATKENYRGNGYAKQILSAIEETAAHLGLDALVLWSDQYTFYAKQGYELKGQQNLYSLSNFKNSLAQPIGNVEYGWDVEEIRKIYETHPYRCRRTDHYWASLGKIKSCRKMQWISEDGEVLAYLAFNRGKDLHGIVHEWGYKNEAAMFALVAEAKKSNPDLMWMTHPSLKDPIRDQIGNESLIQEGHLALVKTLNLGLDKDWFDQCWFWGLDSL